MIIKPVVVGNTVEIRSQDGTVVIRAIDKTPLKAIRKMLNLIDHIEEDKENRPQTKMSEFTEK